MGWFQDILDGASDIWDDYGEGTKTALQLGLGYLAKDQFSAQTPAVGYQGGIPKYDAVRERVPLDDTNRNAGEAGRRYFSDTLYAASPEGRVPPTVAQAQAMAQAQAQKLATDPTARLGNTPPPNGNTPNTNNNNNTGEGTPNTNEQPSYENEGGGATMEMAHGGIASVNKGYYLGGQTDGMADQVPARIDGEQEARLSDGEFVIPADVVSHLGNGNSEAGSQQLHGMMDSVRKARTGNPEQGKEIDPNKFMPTMSQGGIARAYNYGGGVKTNFPDGGDVENNTDTTGTTDTTGDGSNNSGGLFDGLGGEGGQEVGKESSLSNWAGEYVTDMLGKGKALGDQGYQAYTGPLSAGTSELQDQAFTGIGGLTAPTGMGAYTPQTFGAEQATAGMNPYLMASLNPQLDEARRQSEIDRVANAGRMTKAGSFGGSRQALMDMENTRNLQSNLANITGQGYATAYDKAREQFNTEQGRGMEAQNMANQYGFDVLGAQGAAGAEQRAIESEGMGADYAQFKEERDYPYKQVQYMQSLLQGLPLEAQTYSYTGDSQASDLAKGGAGIEDLLKLLGIG